MLLPSIFRNDFVDSFFDDVFIQPANFSSSVRTMKTDIQELENEYQLDIELPGYDKKDINVELKNGNLTVYVDKKEEKEEKSEDGKYIRKERYIGRSSRSFRVGNHLDQEDIHASYKNGLLRIAIPKKNRKKDEKKNIPIE